MTGALAGTRALVMGLGRFGGGLGVTRYLLSQGAAVTVTDLALEGTLAASLASLTDAETRAVQWRLGQHVDADFDAAELVVVNPAVPPTSPYLARARANGARITSEVELFLAAAEAHLVLVTGTQGKSSTAHFSAGLLASDGRRVRLAGNIGRSLLAELDSLGPHDEVVIELSSYQLDALPPDTRALAKAEVAVITNLLSDHLARHGDLASYHAAKLRIAELVRPGGLVLLAASIPETPALAARLAERGLRCATFSCDEPATFALADGAFTGPSGRLADIASLALSADWQRPNALAALAVAAERGISVNVLDSAIQELTGLEHRSQELGRFGPAATRVIDNGVSTTPDSTQAALESAGSAPVVLLIGGRSKGLPLDELVAASTGRLAHVVAFGEAAPEFAGAFEAAGFRAHQVPSVEAAVALGLQLAAPGETVLFSPAGSSFDAYSNFKQRAEAFLAALGPGNPRRAARIEL